MLEAKPWVDGGAALSAFIAAGFWFWSAKGKIPLMGSYYNFTPPTDPFYMAFKRSLVRSKIAAVAAGISAVLTGASLAIGIIYGAQ